AQPRQEAIVRSFDLLALLTHTFADRRRRHEGDVVLHSFVASLQSQHAFHGLGHAHWPLLYSSLGSAFSQGSSTLRTHSAGAGAIAPSTTVKSTYRVSARLGSRVSMRTQRSPRAKTTTRP